MKKTSLIYLLAIAILSTTACNKNGDKIELATNDYLIFGTYHGFCTGNCTLLYKLENNSLFQDDLEIGIPEEVPFQSTPLPNAQYQIAAELVGSFPNDLLASAKRTYGCPDCADQGGFYVQLFKNGVKDTWHIDTADSEQNQAILDYKQKILDVMGQL